MSKLPELILVKSETGNVLFVNTFASTHYFRIEEMNCLEADGSYTKFYMANIEEPIRTSRNIKYYNSWYSAQDKIVRISRSLIINVKNIREIKKQPNGSGLIIFRDESHYRVSSMIRKRLVAIMARE
jgi:DNA-binding LytR/AlgR family response regulator